MKNLTHPAGWAVAALVAVLVGVGKADDKPKPPAPKKPTVMQRKLTHAQKVLEGLAKEDYDKIRAGADGLVECVKDATWRINDTDKYVLFSGDFLRSAENLRTAAKDKKVDTAALAYVDMTLTCVKCHRYLRDEGITRAPDLSPLAPRAAATK